ncbi:MAG: hypothetical protein WD638_08605 [Nitriliruptoraceae bacterium]
MKLLAGFQLVTGIGMVVLWTALLATSQVPELAAGSVALFGRPCLRDVAGDARVDG